RLLWALAAAWIVPVAVVAFRHASALWAVLLSGPALILLGLGTRARVAAVAFVLADLLVAGHLKLEILQPPPDLAPDRDALARLGDRGFRYQSDQVLPYHVPYLYDVRELSGFLNPIVLKRQEDLMAHVSAPLLEKMNVRWWWSKQGFRDLPDAVPLGRVYAAAETADAAAALARLGAPGPPAPRDRGLAPPGDPPDPPSSPPPPVAARLVPSRRNRIELAVDAPGPGILVINEAFSPGWRADVNDREATVFRANYYLRSVVVP